MNEKLTVAIIGGSGKFGAWYARFFKQKGFRVVITGRDEAKLKSVAEELGVEHSRDNKKAASEADYVIVSTPVETVPTTVEEVAPHLKKGALLVDFASVKSEACKAMEKLRHLNVELASVHPMHGPRVSFLRNVPVAFIPVKPGEKYSLLKRLFSSEGADVVETAAEEHDRIVAAVQGLTHFVCIAAARAFKELGLDAEKVAAFSTPTYELLQACVARVVLQDPRLYASIQLENPLNKKARAAFAKAASALAEAADSGNAVLLEKEIEAAARVFSKRAGEATLRKSDEAVQAILSARVSERISENRLAVLGPPGTFSDLAAELYEREKGRRQRLYFGSIPGVFEAVSKGTCGEGIAPVENMIEGTVAVTLDSLFSSGLKVRAEVLLPIHHCLAALPGTKLKEVARVVSHSQALAQCRKWLQKNLPDAKLVEAQSTAEAISSVAAKKEFGSAAIGSREAAELNRLEVLAENIEDEAGNVTRFFVVSKEDSKPSGNDRTSIALHAYKDRPGLLRDILEAFSSKGINLSKIESRPAKMRFGDYVFYIDLEGHREQENVRKALAEITEFAKVKVFGSYPRAF